VFVIFLEVEYCFYFLQWKKDPILKGVKQEHYTVPVSPVHLMKDHIR